MTSMRRAQLGVLLLFAAACGDGTGPGATTGAIRVTTVGSGPGAVFHGLYVDGVQDGAIGASAVRLIEGLAPGTYSVGLATITANCAWGQNPRPVSVTAGSEATVTFTIACAEPEGMGSISIDIETTGSGLDPDGYAVALDGVTQAGPLNGSFAIGNVADGEHTLELLGVADGCVVAGSAERTVQTETGTTSAERFEVTCGGGAA